MAESLLTAESLRRLDHLELETRRVFAGQIKGERRSKRKGISIEFADYRHYTRGDDLRFMDWNIYGRTDRLFIKVFYEEQDLQCNLLIDTSLSMDFGSPHKLDYARRLAAALAYIGLKNNDLMGLTSFHGNTGGPGGGTAAAADRMRPTRGRHQVRRTLAWLDGLKPDGAASLRDICRDFSLRPGARGIVVLISDLLDPAGHESALRYLIRDNLNVHVLHLLSPQEIRPDLDGHIELHDIETDEKIDLTVNARLREIYMRNVEAWTTQVQDYCTHYGMAYSLVDTSISVEDLLLKHLRAKGLLRG